MKTLGWRMGWDGRQHVIEPAERLETLLRGDPVAVERSEELVTQLLHARLCAMTGDPTISVWGSHRTPVGSS